MRLPAIRRTPGTRQGGAGAVCCCTEWALTRTRLFLGLLFGFVWLAKLSPVTVVSLANLTLETAPKSSPVPFKITFHVLWTRSQDTHSVRMECKLPVNHLWIKGERVPSWIKYTDFLSHRILSTAFHQASPPSPVHLQILSCSEDTVVIWVYISEHVPHLL